MLPLSSAAQSLPSSCRCSETLSTLLGRFIILHVQLPQSIAAKLNPEANPFFGPRACFGFLGTNDMFL